MKFLTISAAAAILSLVNVSQARPTAVANRPACQETHLVIAQETCQSIATKYGQPQSDIEQWSKKINDQFDCNNLKVGESICVKYGDESDIDKRGLKHDKKKKPQEKKPKHPKTTTTHHKKPALTPAPVPSQQVDAPKDNKSAHEESKSIDKRGELDDKHDKKKPKHYKTTTTTHHKKPVPTPAPQKEEAPKGDGHEESKPIDKRGEHEEKHEDMHGKKPKHPKATTTTHHKKPTPTPAPVPSQQFDAPKDSNGAHEKFKPIDKRGEHQKKHDKKKPKHPKTTTTHHKKPAPTPAPKKEEVPKNDGQEENNSINKRGEHGDDKSHEKKPKHKTTTTVKRPLPKKTIHKKKHSKKDKKTIEPKKKNDEN